MYVDTEKLLYEKFYFWWFDYRENTAVSVSGIIVFCYMV